MADAPPLTLRVADSVGSVEARAWDAVAGTRDPFLSHAFLALLEDSASVGAPMGWQPLPLLGEDGGRLTAAAPAYLKTHSQGEYVFDHGWAEAWTRAGGEYYPKLLIAVPFTPVVGPRLLGGQREALLGGAEAVVRQNGLSSAHITFLPEEEALAAEARGWLIREGLQYHWRNRGYGSFADFAAALSSRKRKAVRKEREGARAGLTFRHLRGGQIAPADMAAMWAFYQDTGARKWGTPYLTRAFFDRAVERLGDRLLLFLADRDGKPVAGALNLVGEDTLYGRYWGALEEVPFLHFELCYYQSIEWAIAHGLAAVQAGAQGEHKLTRGYEPVRTYSAHFIPHPGFREAVARFLVAEKAAIAAELEALKAELPFRRG